MFATFCFLFVLVLVASYLVGSLNSAIISTFLTKGKDIRQFGSNNAGLTNVYRCFGKLPAALTLLMDLLKGFAVVCLTKLVFFVTASPAGFDTVTACGLASLFAVLGHVFPVFYKFKGGKGILVAATCMAAIDPVVFLCELALFVLLVALTKYISVGSIACCAGYPVFTLAWQLLANAHFGGDYVNIPVHTFVAFLVGLLCFLRHLPNVKRLVAHQESKFALKK